MEILFDGPFWIFIRAVMPFFQPHFKTLQYNQSFVKWKSLILIRGFPNGLIYISTIIGSQGKLPSYEIQNDLVYPTCLSTKFPKTGRIDSQMVFTL